MTIWWKLGAVFAVLAAVWFYRGHIDSQREHIAVLEAQAKARKTETEWQMIFNSIARRQDEQNKAISARLDGVVDELRKRSQRLPEAARAACKGTTGRELSAEDGEFLAREAARADRLRNALEACYATIEIK